jgi:hypothetical protein
MESRKPIDQHVASGKDGNPDDRTSQKARTVPPDFVLRSKPAPGANASGIEEHRGAALDERSYASLQRIARYLRLENVSDCSRAELLERIRAELSW